MAEQEKTVQPETLNAIDREKYTELSTLARDLLAENEALRSRVADLEAKLDTSIPLGNDSSFPRR